MCVERYDHPVPTRGEDGEPAVERRIGEEVAFESWLPAWRTEERQTVRFRIPPDAPYSHEGECLSFAWRVSAREPDRVAEEVAPATIRSGCCREAVGGGEGRRGPRPETGPELRLERERYAPGDTVRGL